MNEKREIANNNMIFIAGNVAAAALAFLFNIMAAALLQPEQFGILSFAIVVMGFFTVFTDPGIGPTVTKFLASYIAKGERGRARSLVGFFISVRLGLTVAVAAVMLVFSTPLAAFFGKPEYVTFIDFSAAMLLTSALISIAYTVLEGLKKFKIETAIKLFERVTRILFVFIFILMGMGATGAVVGVTLSFLLAGMIGMVLFRRKDDIFSAKKEPVEKSLLFSFGAWALIGSTINALYFSIDSIMVSALRPVIEIGFYSIASAWVSLATYITPISAAVMYPYFSSLSREKNTKALDRSIRYALLAAMPVAFLISAFSGTIISVFYKNSFMPASAALGVLSFVSIPLAIEPLMMAYLYGVGRPKTHTKIVSVIFAANILLTYFAIGAFGLWGAALTIVAMRLVEVALLLGAIYLKPARHFDIGVVLKPLAASLVIFAAASLIPVSGLVELVACGLALMAVYVGLMLVVGGIEKNDVTMALDWLRSLKIRKG